MTAGHIWRPAERRADALLRAHFEVARVLNRPPGLDLEIVVDAVVLHQSPNHIALVPLGVSLDAAYVPECHPH